MLVKNFILNVRSENMRIDLAAGNDRRDDEFQEQFRVSQ